MRRWLLLPAMTIAVALAVPGAASAVTTDWTAAGQMGSPRWNFSAAVDGSGTVYVFGGLTGLSATGSAGAERYSGGVWSPIHAMPAARWQAGAAAAPDGKIYLFGGVGPNGITAGTTWAYDPGSNAWTTGLPAMPFARSGAAVATAPDGSIYVAGGSPPGRYVAMARLDRYDPVSETWQTLAPMPSPRADAASAFGADGDLYVFGGITNPPPGHPVTSTTSIYRYDPTLDSWSFVGHTPYASAFNSVVQIDGRFHLIGGGSVASSPLVNAWDGGSSWTCGDALGVGREAFQAVPSGTSIVVAGGIAPGPALLRSAISLDLGGSDTEAPHITAGPTTAVASGGTVSQSMDVPIRAAWRACDNRSAIGSTTLEQRVGSGAYTPVALGGPVATSATVMLPADAASRDLRLTEQDTAANTSVATSAPFAVRLIGDRQFANVHYRGAWTLGSSPNHLSGSDHYTTHAGASASVTFTGRQVAWIGLLSAVSGSARVYADGHLLGTISLHHPPTQPRHVVLVHTFAVTGPHRLTIVAAGTPGHARVDVDGFAVL